MCNGEAHGLFERRIMPICSILLNSSFANASLSGGRRRACECTGGPVVGMKCSTLCLVVVCENVGVIMLGNSASILAYGLSTVEMAAKWGASPVIRPQVMEAKLSASTNRRFLKSTNRLLARKKSAPSSGCGTSAIVKAHSKCRRLKLSKIVRLPYVRMGVWFAASKAGP